MQHFCGIDPDKQFQLADWRIRYGHGCMTVSGRRVGERVMVKLIVIVSLLDGDSEREYMLCYVEFSQKKVGLDEWEIKFDLSALLYR